MDVRETGCESEEHWVEAEIGRLLLAASVDECNSEPVYNQPSSTAAFEVRKQIHWCSYPNTLAVILFVVFSGARERSMSWSAIFNLPVYCWFSPV